MKCLVLYYSRTGHARHLANDLGESLGADVEEIRCDRYHARFVGAFRALHDAVRGRSPARDAAIPTDDRHSKGGR